MKADWKPIETAPKDRNIMVSGGTFSWDDGDGSFPLHEPKEATWDIYSEGWHAVHGEGTNIWIKPTHWDYLPDNP